MQILFLCFFVSFFLSFSGACNWTFNSAKSRSHNFLSGDYSTELKKLMLYHLIKIVMVS